MKFENILVFNFEGALRGMRNPMNSWAKSDSHYDGENYIIGKNDISLATTLIKAGTEHRKFLRQIFVSVDITAPLYWWKEFDTYKVGTVANSTSAMHKLSSTPITTECFALDSVIETLNGQDNSPSGLSVIESVCNLLENYRQEYLRTNDKRVWRALIQLLPSSWLQTRTITMNYENVVAICKQRKHHKLNEWSGSDNVDSPNFISWAHSLPYSKEFIFHDARTEI